jgi:hypothetical protein
MSISVLGDGCRYCQPQEYIDRLIEQMQDDADEAKSSPTEVAQGEALKQRFDQLELEVMQGKHTAASIFTQMRTAALYTTPPSPDAELVELLRECRRAPNNLIWPESILRDRIDAKLASLVPKESP